MPTEDDHPELTQDLYDVFTVVENGDGTQDEAKHRELRELAEAGLGKGSFDGDGSR
jgi:hypothetical protein